MAKLYFTLFFIIKSLSTLNVTCNESIKMFDTKYECISERLGKVVDLPKKAVHLVLHPDTRKSVLLRITVLENDPNLRSETEEIQNKVFGLENVIKRFEVKNDKKYRYESLECPSIERLTKYSQKFNYRKDQKFLLELFLKIVKSVKNMHNVGVIHADIRTDIFGILNNGEPVILEFDNSVLNNRLAPVRGTLEFKPYEEFLLDGSNIVFTEKIDVWSLGASLYRMLYNRNPFKFIVYKYISKGYQDIIKFYEGTSYEIINILLMMLKIDPAQRITMDEVIIKIEEALNNYEKWTYLKEDKIIKNNIDNIFTADFNKINEEVEEVFQENPLVKRLINTKKDVIKIDDISSKSNNSLEIGLGIFLLSTLFFGTVGLIYYCGMNKSNN